MLVSIRGSAALGSAMLQSALGPESYTPLLNQGMEESVRIVMAVPRDSLVLRTRVILHVDGALCVNPHQADLQRVGNASLLCMN